ncbi:hypothetical protein SASPL_122359 [Salvia splendens]|uniref:Uncharacterized protein n=1 Tax=Salvia splendens TaxID=180675 RepID=A0A8X8XP45_SALSN|nr:hypothetical protein SASPL_122359 [Salvia splendens]
MGRAGCVPDCDSYGGLIAKLSEARKVDTVVEVLKRLKNERPTVLEDGDEEEPLKGGGEGAGAPALVADLSGGGERIPAKMVAGRSTIEREWRARVSTLLPDYDSLAQLQERWRQKQQEEQERPCPAPRLGEAPPEGDDRWCSDS